MTRKELLALLKSRYYNSHKLIDLALAFIEERDCKEQFEEYVKDKTVVNGNMLLYEVEYDANYFGGDYTSCGNTIKVKIPEKGGDEDSAIKIAFKRRTGLSPRHIIHYECLEF